MNRLTHNRRTILICGLLAVLALTAFWRVTHNDFIKLDDRQYVTENPHVQGGFTWENVKWAFQAGYASNWHPVTWLSHTLDVRIFGLRPGWHHLINLLLHTANAILLFLVLNRMTGAVCRSAVVAALFAVHPLHVESVAWVAERKDVLSTFFFILTLSAYARYAAGRRPGSEGSGRLGRNGRLGEASLPSRLWYVATLGLFALGLMSKPMLATLPFVLLLLDFWPLGRSAEWGMRGAESGGSARGRGWAGLVAEKVPFFVLAAGSSVLTFLAQAKGHNVSIGLPLGSRIANAIASYLKYLGKTVWPADLAVFYPHPDIRYPVSHQWAGWKIALAALLLIAITVWALFRARRQPWFAVGWFWYLGTLVPVIGIIQVGGQALADRYTYIPLIGVFICLTWGAADSLASLRPGGRDVSPKGPFSPAPDGISLGRLGEASLLSGAQVLLAAAGILAVTGCVLATQRQVKYWRNNLTLFEHALSVTANNAVAHYNIGTELEDQGNYDAAVAHFRTALEYDPSYADAHCSLGFALHALGKVDDALEQYQAAIRLKPWHAQARTSLGAILWMRGQREAAFEQYAEALRLKPDLAQAHYNLGIALTALGRFPEATTHLAEAVRLKPDYPEARTRLSQALFKQGNLAEAEAAMREVVRLYPTNAEARVNLGDLLRLLGRRDEALGRYAEALRLQPDYAVAHYDIGTILLEQGKPAEAATHFAEATRQKPDGALAFEGLGRALALQGKFAQAAPQFREAVRLCPTNAEIQVNLGDALMLTGQSNEAAASFAAALRLEPDLAERNVKQGKALADQGQLDAALGRFMTAACLKPEDADAHENLGLCFARLGKPDEAAAHFEEVVRLRPNAQAYYELGRVQLTQAKTREAAASYQEAVKLGPNWPAALNNLAWILATASDPQLRDGAEAIKLATRACTLTEFKEAVLVGTLAAAYAESGQFQEAVLTAERARELAASAGKKELAEKNRQLVELYRSGKPYHETLSPAPEAR
ncbi:MAG: tetratricopeptide repeat protein [Verrucomicrobiota bacterium]